MNRLTFVPPRYRYQTVEFDQFDIHVRILRDNQQYYDPDGSAEALGVSPASWPLFGLLWASGEALARAMEHFDVTGLRILEVGCGVGLASLVLNERSADITATDYHPDAEHYLAWNTQLNGGDDIPFFRQGWAEPSEFEGRFDLVIAADVLYEPDHTLLLAEFIATKAKPNAEVIIVDPSRGYLTAFSRHMLRYGFDQQEFPDPFPTPSSLDYKGQFRRYLRRDTANNPESYDDRSSIEPSEQQRHLDSNR